MTGDFDDLLAANARYSTQAPRNFDGIAHAGIAVVTCMDSRLQPLEMLGLFLGEAKILRTPGGRVTPDALIGCVLGAQLLQVDRILVIAHTRCAMASGTDEEIRARVLERTGTDLGDMHIGATVDQEEALVSDVSLLRSHPAIGDRVKVGGFLYDVDSGLLRQLV
ncbi:MAG TPA: carbonic anhydrase [Propionibacteriaceae bacterium]|nr:carbonic anhydrase [Propionibacteriaceae bacterium]